jgi:predicted O-methyltransferase YrrM
MEMTPERWDFTCAYLRDVFGGEDEQLRSLMRRAVQAGLPDIAVSADVGRLLMMLTRMTANGAGARVAIEVGTLGGYSGIWIARGLGRGGRLITIEANARHANFAEQEFAAAGVGASVDIRRGKALDLLPSLVAELRPGSVDVVFLDALKPEYPEYFQLLRPVIAPGGLLLADNVLGTEQWWIDTPAGSNADRDGADRLNRLLASDPEFEAVALPIREGVLVARRTSV